MSAARRSLQVVAFVCTLIVGVASMALIVTQTTWFKEWLRGFIVRQAEDYVNGRLSIGRLDGNLFFGVELEDVDVTQNGKTVVDVKDLIVDYNVFTVIGGDVVLDEIRLNQPMIRAERTASGWNLTQLIKARTPDPDEAKSRRTLEIHDIAIADGTLYIEDGAVGTSGYEMPERIEKLDASIGIKTNEDELTVDVNRVSLRAQRPAIGINELSGVIRRTPNQITLENVVLRTEESALRIAGTIGNIESGTPTVELRASSDKLALAEIGRLVPVLRGYDLQPAFDVTATGPLDRIGVKADVREHSLGHVNGDLMVDSLGPERRIAGSAAVENFNVGKLVPRRGSAPPSTLQSDITGEGTFDIALPSGRMPLSGTYNVRASHVEVAGYQANDVAVNGRIDGRVVRVNATASAYGGQATAAGTVKYGTPLALDLSGRAANIDLRNLPPQLNIPGAPSRLQLSYKLTGRGNVFSGDVEFRESTLAGATIAPGTIASVTIGDGGPRYRGKGQVSNLDVAQIGRAFNVRALATERYQSAINGTFDVTGSGGGARYPLTLDTTGTLVDSQMFGASVPRLDFTANVGSGDIAVKALGQFADLDPAVVTENERLAGNLSGAVDAQTTIRNYTAGVTAQSIDIAGRVNLGNSTLGGLAIDSAVVDGTYADRAGQLTQLSITGPDLNVTGQGAIALNETGSSNLTLHLDSASLERVGELVGQPLKGAAVVDATVTGNASELTAAGHLQGSNIGYGDNSALTLSTDFTLATPDLTPAATSLQAKSVATFVQVGGQQLTELAADTTYGNSNLAFNATAKEGVRQLSAAGDVVVHPDHQEIHVHDLALQAEAIRWTTAPGTEATIRYGNDRIEVNNLRLASGDQRIVADGVIGSPAATLKVRAENVDVAQLDQLALGQQRLAGRLNANATVTGELRSPRVEGDFTLTRGAFRAFQFESFAGKVDYVGSGMNVDVRLQQNSEAWLTAKGYAPLTLLRPTPEGVIGHAAPPPGEEVSLEVASSRIDLGVVQGFTSYVTNVAGTLQANVKITGSGYDPHMNGAIDIQGGAFDVPDLGTNYTGLDTRVDLNDEGLNIAQFKILDSRGFPMTVGGSLALHERAVGAVDISIQSDKFEVIDNELADLKLNTQLHVTGDVRKPRVEGSIEVENGTIHVEQILEMATADPYATSATEINPVTLEGTTGRALTMPAPTLFEAVELNIGLVVPSNLVLNGQDLTAPNAPVSLGDMNVTVGGQLEIKKAPGAKPRVLGEVNTVRGSYTFQGRRFEIMRDGRIRFDGGEEIDPLIDLRAMRRIQAVEAMIRVQGTLRAPELSFSSNPPLEQADILSLIVFNAPVNALGEAQQASLGERAGALAGGYLASGLARSIGNALELDEFEISAQGEDGAGPSLSVGEQVGEKLFVRLRQAFGSAQATELILEYQINEFLRAQAAVAEAAGGTQRVTFRRVERGGLDLIFFFSY